MLSCPDWGAVEPAEAAKRARRAAAPPASSQGFIEARLPQSGAPRQRLGEALKAPDHPPAPERVERHSRYAAPPLGSLGASQCRVPPSKRAYGGRGSDRTPLKIATGTLPRPAAPVTSSSSSASTMTLTKTCLADDLADRRAHSIDDHRRLVLRHDFLLSVATTHLPSLFASTVATSASSAAMSLTSGGSSEPRRSRPSFT